MNSALSLQANVFFLLKNIDYVNILKAKCLKLINKILKYEKFQRLLRPSI